MNKNNLFWFEKQWKIKTSGNMFCADTICVLALWVLYCIQNGRNAIANMIVSLLIWLHKETLKFKNMIITYHNLVDRHIKIVTNLILVTNI